MQVGDGGDALKLRRRAEAGDVAGVEFPAHRVVAEAPEQAQARRDPLQRAGRGAVGQLRHAFDRRRGVEARHLQKQAVDDGDVQARVMDHHRAGGRDPVEVVSGQARAPEMQGVEAPAVEQLVGIGYRRGGGREPPGDGLDRAQARHVAPVRAAPVARAHIGLPPERALHHVGMALDEARQQDLLYETAIDPRIDAGDVLGRPHRQHAAAPHRHVRGDGPRGIHRDDPPRLEDRDVARHGCPRHVTEDAGRFHDSLAPDAGDEGSQDAALRDGGAYGYDRR